MNQRSQNLFALFLPAVMACQTGAKSVGELDGSGEASGTESSGSASDSMSSTSAGTTSTSSGGETDSGTETGTEDSGSTGGESVCDPQPQGVEVAFLIDGEDMPVNEQHVAEDCVISDIDDSVPGQVTIALDGCQDPNMPPDPHAHVIEASANPDFFLIQPNDNVVFDYVGDSPFYTLRWFKLSGGAGSLILAGVASVELAPFGVEPNDWYAPLTVSIASGVCDPEPDGPGSFVGGCGTIERQALDAEFGTGMDRIFDGNSGSAVDQLAGGVGIDVESATAYIELNCDDVPDKWYEMLFVWIPEG